VYGLFKGNVWIYFGESGDVRARLLDHLANETNACITRSAPTHFAYELVPGELARKARQNGLILEYNPPCNQRLG